MVNVTSSVITHLFGHFFYFLSHLHGSLITQPNRITTLFEEKIFLCGFLQCADPEVFLPADLFMHKCGQNNDNCDVDGPLPGKIKSSLEDIAIEKTGNRILLEKKEQNWTVDFDLEIFTDLVDENDVRATYSDGMTAGKSSLLDFQFWEFKDTNFEFSGFNHLSKFESSFIVPTVRATKISEIFTG